MREKHESAERLRLRLMMAQSQSTVLFALVVNSWGSNQMLLLLLLPLISIKATSGRKKARDLKKKEEGKKHTLCDRDADRLSSSHQAQQQPRNGFLSLSLSLC